jgi:hypothetical protein
MKATELRIGNFIMSGNNGEFDHDGLIGKVLEIGNEDREFEQIYCECEESFEWFFKGNYFGIPLTDDWLIKFGFIDGQKDVIKLIRINKFYYLCYVTGSKRLNVDIMYVHQLQNLYYALTGVELSVHNNPTK